MGEVITGIAVSIPERVLEALKPLKRRLIQKGGEVSIPERVLEALKRQI